MIPASGLVDVNLKGVINRGLSRDAKTKNGTKGTLANQV